MKILKYIILGLIILNIPSVLMVYQGPGISSLISYFIYILLIAYYILSNKSKLNLWMIAIGLLFFSISSLIDSQYLPVENRDFIMYILKYFITVICGYELLKNTSSWEITLFLFVGALTIVLQIFLFNNPLVDYGRYSGFYINPNAAGFICLVGYGLSFAAQNKKFRLILQIIFTVMGLLTFSRTFIALWLLTNLISVKIDIKNIRVFLYGFGLLTIFVIFSKFLPVQNPRLEQIKAIISGEQIQTAEINEDSRTETWSLFYDALFERPILGSGYNSFSGHSHISTVGVHNSYLKIWGEAGIIVFAIFIGMYLVMIRDTLQIFKTAPHLFLIAISVILFLTTNHNFFDNSYILLISMWIQAEISKNNIELST
ncbi:hypothetical protein C21_02226 [Arenibacter sp. NBRC 103722]|uniref:O-antigen ligase family protein n=1 Tax=Arenibacter sp. NBRC 103722 TaxID=1113929 RepID=UPI0008538F64|nr:O-antigen ligase family protein [Arenibacter sp. NBRC 103722]GBF20055.1 hypothetical protein C21_02226 [Arenibacter sp. NBRC 103722]